jgi:nucleoside phosphorylase
VGQCSGLDRSKQSIGDVVVASDVIYYEPGIIGSDTEQMRFRVSGTTSKSVLDVARELADQVQDLPPIHIGTMASGEKIISDSTLFAKTLSRWSNVAAVEMEGAGVFEAAAATGRNIMVAVVRGISDFVDRPRTDDFRVVASRNAVRVALEQIRRLTER